MRLIAVALMFIALLVVPAQPAAAQTRECDFARLLPEPLRRFLGRSWVGEVTVPVEGVPVTVQMCATQSQSYRAAYLLDRTDDALWALDRRTDARLTGDVVRQIAFISTAEMRSYGADGFITSDKVIYLSEDSADSTLVHELAHYWADSRNFGEDWMVEAYAEYLTSLVAPEIGMEYSPFPALQMCAGQPLVSLSPRGPNPELFRCAYSAGPRVLHRLGEAVGHDTVGAAISGLSQDSRQITSLGLLNALEQMSGADLTQIYIEGRVLPASEDERLMRRGVLRAALRQAEAEGADLGLVAQGWLAELIYAMRLDEASPHVNGLSHLVRAAWERENRCRDVGLRCETSLANLPAGPADLVWLRADLEARAALVDSYRRVRDGAEALGLPVPGVVTAAATGDVPGMLPGPQVAAGVLAEAEATLGRIAHAEERCAGLAGLACRGLWAEAWGRGDWRAADGAAAELTGLLDAAAALEGRCGPAGGRCRELWQAELARGGSDAALATVERLQGMIEEAGAVAEGCGAARATCLAYWQKALGEGEEEAQGALSLLRATLDVSKETAAACAAAGWPCDEGWATALRDGEPEKARDMLGRQVAKLDSLVELEGRLRALGGPALLLDRILPAHLKVEGRLAAARRAFAAGEVDEAARQAEEAIALREMLNLAALGLAGLLALGGVLTVAAWRPWRRGRGGPPQRKLARAATRQQDNALLAQLLAGSPDDPRARP